jgi:hypothetical protein
MKYNPWTPTPITDTPKREWWRFSIREMIFVAIIVVMVLGWWIDRNISAARNAEWERCFRDSLEKLSLETNIEQHFLSPEGPWTVSRQKVSHK